MSFHAPTEAPHSAMPADAVDALRVAKVDFTAEASAIDPDEGYEDHRSVRRQWLEFVVMCLCNVAWTVDAQLLPLFFKEFQIRFQVSQTELSSLATAKGCFAALFAFPCGFVGEMLPRPQLVGFGMLFWAAGLALCASAVNFQMMFVGRVLNGVGLGLVQPLLLSLVADKNPPSKRGSAFGSMFFVGAICNTLFGLVATKYAATKIGALAGWRVSITAVVAFSSLVGVAMMVLVGEPNAAHLASRRKEQGFISVFRKNLPKVWQLFRYPTFVLILCQGAPGTAPWTVFPFFTQWLELSCFTHGETAVIFAAFSFGAATSNLVSGLLLNFVARRCPDHGPPTIANFSVAVGTPFLALFFFILPKPAALGQSGGLVGTYSATFAAFGLLAAMCGMVNKKVFADIVPQHMFTYVFAIDQLIEHFLGNFAGLAVGLITDQVFDYDQTAVAVGACAPEEGRKLGLGMFVVCTAAWFVCFTVYVFLHCTYPKDRRRQLVLLRAQALTSANAQLSGPEAGEGPLSELPPPSGSHGLVKAIPECQRE